MAKTQRRYCDYQPCGKLYRYINPRSKTCSGSCRTRLSKANRRQSETVLSPEYQRIADHLAAAMSVETPVPAPVPVAVPAETPAPRRLPLPPVEHQVITITQPKRAPMTPLPRGYRPY